MFAIAISLVLGDNLAEVLSFERGRARDHGLNAYCRQAAGLQIALNCRWRRRYVETDRNASDHDSRLADRANLQLRSFGLAPKVSCVVWWVVSGGFR